MLISYGDWGEESSNLPGRFWLAAKMSCSAGGEPLTPSCRPGILWPVDYVAWALFQKHERGDCRFYDIVASKIIVEQTVANPLW